MVKQEEALDFLDVEVARAWLMRQPRKVCVVIASRAAMRAMPALYSVFQDRSKSDNLVSEIVLPVLRAVAASWAAGRYPARGKELSAIAVAAADAASAARAAYDDVAHAAAAVAADAEQIADGLSAEELASQPLWRGAMPAELETQWKGLKDELLGLDQGWEVWSAWYEARLKGAPALEVLEVARLKIPEDIWKQGPKAVNTEIRRLIDEHG